MEVIKLIENNKKSNSNLVHKLKLEEVPKYKPTVPHTAALSVEELKQKRPDVNFTQLNVKYNNAFKKLNPENIVHFEPRENCSAVTPYEYIQNGGKMIVNYPDSYMYLMPPTSNLLEDKIKEFRYDNFNSILFWIYFKDGKNNFIRLANFEIEIINKYVLVSLRDEQKMLSILVRGKNNRQIEIPLSKYEFLFQEIVKENPEYRLYVDSKREVALFKQYCSEVYEYSNINSFDEYVYLQVGIKVMKYGVIIQVME